MRPCTDQLKAKDDSLASLQRAHKAGIVQVHKLSGELAVERDDRLVEVLPEDERDAVGDDAKDGSDPKDRLLWRARRAALSEAVRLAGEICEGGPVAIRAGLQAVSWAREEVENAMYERVVGTEDRNEALQAFKEKRQPVFKGR